MAKDTADVGQEAHVEHAIRFVEHQILKAAEPRVRRTEMVEQTAGRPDDDVDAAAKRVLLRPHADAAEYSGSSDGRVHREIVEVAEDLGRELAGRRQNERPRDAAALVDQALEDGQQERGRLAASSHCRREKVASVERGRNRIGLNGRRTREAEILQTSEQMRMEPEG